MIARRLVALLAAFLLALGMAGCGTNPTQQGGGGGGDAVEESVDGMEGTDDEDPGGMDHVDDEEEEQ